MLGDKAVALAQSLIRCESVTPRDAGAIEVLIHALKPARFVCEHLSLGEGDGRIENLYARVGEGPPHLCFAGHTDVVPPGDAKLWRHPPFAANVLGGVLYGR
ncbi:MAG: succinyl-diaminopimelate desuccinylase, partial [Terriglobia bacterium]